MSVTDMRYTRTAVILHWLIGLGLIAMLFFGWWMSDLPKEGPEAASYDLFNWGIYTVQLSEAVSPRTFYFNLHKSIGFTILLLVAFRIFWRILHHPPALLPTLKQWERKLATATHHLLYLLMALVPISGLIMTLYSKWGLKWFGIKVLPGLDDKGIRDIFHELHEWFGIILAVVIVLHVLGALKHKFIDKDATMSRMTWQ
jgi:cytochrome b561